MGKKKATELLDLSKAEVEVLKEPEYMPVCFGLYDETCTGEFCAFVFERCKKVTAGGEDDAGSASTEEVSVPDGEEV